MRSVDRVASADRAPAKSDRCHPPGRGSLSCDARSLSGDIGGITPLASAIASVLPAAITATPV